jgi:predicted ATPase
LNDALKSSPNVKPDAENEWSDYAPLLNNIIPSLRLPETRVTSGFSKQQKVVHTRNLVKHIIQTRSKDLMLIIALDNIHTMDSASLQLAFEVAKEVQTMMFVLTSRPPTDPPLEYQMICALPNARLLKLERLNDDETVATFCHRFGVESAPRLYFFLCNFF